VTGRRIREVGLLRLVTKTKSTANLSVHQDGGRSSTGIPEILGTETSTAEI
jgi:hypothetical protein